MKDIPKRLVADSAKVFHCDECGCVHFILYRNTKVIACASLDDCLPDFCDDVATAYEAFVAAQVKQ